MEDEMRTIVVVGLLLMLIAGSFWYLSGSLVAPPAELDALNYYSDHSPTEDHAVEATEAARRLLQFKLTTMQYSQAANYLYNARKQQELRKSGLADLERTKPETIDILDQLLERICQGDDHNFYSIAEVEKYLGNLYIEKGIKDHDSKLLIRGGYWKGAGTAVGQVEKFHKELLSQLPQL
jgi:hypothetical protein